MGGVVRRAADPLGTTDVISSAVEKAITPPPVAAPQPGANVPAAPSLDTVAGAGTTTATGLPPDADEEERKRRNTAGGRASTILTSPLGSMGGASGGRRFLGAS